MIIRKLTCLRIFNILVIAINYITLKLFKTEFFLVLPFSITIEPTNICNLSCPQCSTGLGLYDTPKGMVPINGFKKLADTFQYHTTMLQLHFRGEPMLHPELFQLITYASSRKFYVSLSTNGHFIIDNVEKIIDSRLDHINISLDGITNESYLKYREKGNIEKVIKGIEKLAAFKAEKKLNYPRVTLQMLISEYNKEQVKQFRKFEKIDGINKCLIKKMQIIDKKTEKEFVSDNKLIRKEIKGNRTFCLKTLTTSVFTWQGKLLPCCYDKAEKFILYSNDSFYFETYKLYRLMKNFRKKLNHSNIMPEMCCNCEESVKRVFIKRIKV